MKVAPVLKALALAKASLGDAASPLPILSHFCFLGDMLYAYNDITATVFFEPTGLNCALHGDTFIGVLEASGADEVGVEIKDGYATLDASGGRVKVPTLTADDFIFTMPEGEPLVSVKITDELVKGIELCMKSVGADSLRPEFAGVTFSLRKGVAQFMSTDNETAARYRVPGSIAGRKEISVVIPAQGCEQLLRLQKARGGGTIAFTDKDMQVSYEDSGTLICVLVSKVFAARVDMLETIFTKHADGGAAQVPIPVLLTRELKKASIVLAREASKACMITARDGTWFVEAKGDLGSVNGHVGGVDKRSSGTVVVDPDTLIRMLGYTETVCINTNESIVLVKGGYTGVISHKAAAASSFVKSKHGVEDLDDDIPF